MQPLSSECKVKTFSCRLHEIIVSFSRKIPKYGVFLIITKFYSRCKNFA